MSDMTLITEFLTQLGLDEHEQSVYIALTAHGAMTLSELSRISGVERTSLYRMIDTLQNRGVIKIQDEQKRKIIYPAKPGALLRIIDEEETRLHGLRQQQGSFTRQIEQIMGTRTDTDVTYYRGIEGIKQIQWNILRAQGSCLFGVRDSVLESIVEDSFVDQWAIKFTKAKLRADIVYSDSFIESMRQEAPGLSNNPLSDILFHYVTPHQFDITHCFDTFDEYVIYYNWGEEDPYAVEIRNKHIAYSTCQHIEYLIKTAQSKKSWMELRNEL